MLRRWMQSIATHVAIILGALFLYKRSKRKAANAAVEQERQRIINETHAIRKRKQAKVDEIDQIIDDIPCDDLVRRMRENAKD